MYKLKKYPLILKVCSVTSQTKTSLSQYINTKIFMKIAIKLITNLLLLVSIIVIRIVWQKMIFFVGIVLANNRMIISSWNLVIKIIRVLLWLRKKNRIPLVTKLMSVIQTPFRLVINLILLIMLFKLMRRFLHRKKKSVRLKKFPSEALLTLRRVSLRWYLIYCMEQNKFKIINPAILNLIGRMLFLNRCLICLRRKISIQISIHKI